MNILSEILEALKAFRDNHGQEPSSLVLSNKSELGFLTLTEHELPYEIKGDLMTKGLAALRGMVLFGVRVKLDPEGSEAFRFE